MINMQKWQELPPNYKAIVTAACQAATADMQASYDWNNPPALKELAANGAQLRPFSPEILQASFQASNETYVELSASNADFKKLYDAAVAYRKDAYLWFQISEYTFDTFMMIQQREGKL